MVLAMSATIMSRRPSRLSARAPNGIRRTEYATTSTTAIALTWSGSWVSCRTYSGTRTFHAASPIFEMPWVPKNTPKSRSHRNTDHILPAPAPPPNWFSAAREVAERLGGVGAGVDVHVVPAVGVEDGAYLRTFVGVGGLLGHPARRRGRDRMP